MPVPAQIGVYFLQVVGQFPVISLAHQPLGDAEFMDDVAPTPLRAVA